MRVEGRPGALNVGLLSCVQRELPDIAELRAFFKEEGIKVVPRNQTFVLDSLPVVDESFLFADFLIKESECECDEFIKRLQSSNC